MAIKRWYATADTTVTNAYKEGFGERGEEANMGASDSLEVFTLHGQASQEYPDSKESSRILVRFDIEKLRDSLVAEDVPNPGKPNKPKYFLRLFNAPHPEALPQNFSLTVHNMNDEFDEGTGLDMSEYADGGAASWKYAKLSAGGTGTGAITVSSNPTTGQYFNIIISDQSTQVQAGGSATATRDAIVTALGGHSLVTVAAGSGNSLTITSKVAGKDGNYRYYVDNSSGDFATADYYMTGGNDFTAWSVPMAPNAGPFPDTGVNPLQSPAPARLGKVDFDTGEEDIVLDITAHMESVIWDSGSLRSLSAMNTSHKGFLIKILDETSTSSIYTKKFFSRTSQFFYKRPCIEARWDDTVKDNRANFFTKSAVSSANTQNIYLYNSEGGVRTNLVLGSGNLFVRFYTDSSYSTLATLDPTADFIQATAVSGVTGVYQAAVVIDEPSATKIYDKWYVASAGGAAANSWTVVHSGSFDVSQRMASSTTKKQRYVFDITNLKNSYSRSEKPRFRLYSRLKDWSPTIYTKAKNSLENHIIDKVYYKIFRVTDDEELYGYGIGTSGTNSNHTLLSYDSEGNYFDFDMSLLESGYMYGIRLMTMLDGELREHKEIFKFRVD